MKFKPVEITLPTRPPSLFEEITTQFIGQKVSAEMLYSMKGKANSMLHSMLAKGEIESIPKVYVGMDGDNSAMIHTPQYKHDCDSCEYLGRYEDVDLYYCKDSPTSSLIARFSSIPSDYTSMPAWAEPGESYSFPPHVFMNIPYSRKLKEAKRRAIASGLLKREVP